MSDLDQATYRARLDAIEQSIAREKGYIAADDRHIRETVAMKETATARVKRLYAEKRELQARWRHQRKEAQA